MMKQILLFFKKRTGRALLFAACCTVLFNMSCTEIYDNIKDFSIDEIVYPGRFDIAVGHIGYERIEIDLSRYGRIPSSQMDLGKAKKTIITYNDTIITIDSVCSWVNIKNLKLPNLYRFKIYTADEFGNKSTPVETTITPYTAYDLAALKLSAPSIIQSTTSAGVEWKTRLSSNMYDVCSYSYSYTDRDGNIRSGGQDGDAIAFLVENVRRDNPVTVEMKIKIVPKVDRVTILDTIEWTYPVVVTVNGTIPVIFLDNPSTGTTFGDAELPVLSWRKVDEVSDYTLKISDNETFSDDARTISIPVGNTDSYAMTENDFTQLLAASTSARPLFFWTAIPTVSGLNVITQNRSLSRGLKIIHLRPDSGPGQMIMETLPDGVYTFMTTGTDPTIYSTSIGKILNPGISSDPGKLTVTFEYQATEDFPFEFFFSRPNAAGGASATTQVPRSDVWREHTFDIGGYAVQFSWGTAANHRFRLDIGAKAGLSVYLRNIQLNIR